MSRKKRGETVRLELRKLSATVKENIFTMVKMACDVLADENYVDAFGGYDKVLNDLEKNEFSHFGGKPSLSSMIAAFRKNPTIRAWKEYAFNIQAMIELANPREERETVRINWKARCGELELDLEKANQALAAAQQTIAGLRDELESERSRPRLAAA